ncbi:hypothetical protein [Pseudomonas akapageensis]|uniref:hypothetical protein n=1 Tax=Pseudomonas akapageensis TaxID=2609961 RepID=UPI001409FB1A|nr:hypothetical protein [Pseudomonas akapageensis]
MKGTRLWVAAFLAVLTNGDSLLGVGQASAGSLAKGIESNHNIAHSIENAKAHGMLAGTPPSKPRQVIAGPFLLDCSVLPRCIPVADPAAV